MKINILKPKGWLINYLFIPLCWGRCSFEILMIATRQCQLCLCCSYVSECEWIYKCITSALCLAHLIRLYVLVCFANTCTAKFFSLSIYRVIPKHQSTNLLMNYVNKVSSKKIHQKLVWYYLNITNCLSGLDSKEKTLNRAILTLAIQMFKIIICLAIYLLISDGLSHHTTVIPWLAKCTCTQTLM